jgi:DNA repair protein RecO (recombination protein O)
VFLHKSSEALDLLTEAKLDRRFRSAQRDLARLYAGYYIAELVAELTHMGDPHRDLFNAADAALLALDQDASVTDTVLKFELTALRLVGHLPTLLDCAVCGRPIESQGHAAFGFTAGGVLCNECRVGKRAVARISTRALAALRHAAGANYAATGRENSEGTAQRAGELPDETTKDRALEGELRGLMGNYLAHLIGHRLKMSNYLKRRDR